MKTTLHTILTILLALFFIYKGVNKIPIKIKSITQEEIIETIIERGSYEAPVGYKITMNTMGQSGFLRLIAFFSNHSRNINDNPQNSIGWATIFVSNDF